MRATYFSKTHKRSQLTIMTLSPKRDANSMYEAPAMFLAHPLTAPQTPGLLPTGFRVEGSGCRGWVWW